MTEKITSFEEVQAAQKESAKLPHEIVSERERQFMLSLRDEEAKLKRAAPEAAERAAGEEAVTEALQRFKEVKQEAENDLAAIEAGRRPMGERTFPAPERTFAEKFRASAREEYEENERALLEDIARAFAWTGKNEKHFTAKIETLLDYLEKEHPDANPRTLVRELLAEDVLWSRLDKALLYKFCASRQKYHKALAVFHEESPAVLEKELASVPTADELPEDLEL